jgi:uncharacterized protein involved in type VI secretion and phage assembly
LQVKQSGRQPQVLGEQASVEGSTYSNKFLCIRADVSCRPHEIAKN